MTISHKHYGKYELCYELNFPVPPAQKWRQRSVVPGRLITAWGACSNYEKSQNLWNRHEKRSLFWKLSSFLSSTWRSQMRMKAYGNIWSYVWKSISSVNASGNESSIGFFEKSWFSRFLKDLCSENIICLVQPYEIRQFGKWWMYDFHMRDGADRTPVLVWTST